MRVSSQILCRDILPVEYALTHVSARRPVRRFNVHFQLKCHYASRRTTEGHLLQPNGHFAS